MLFIRSLMFNIYFVLLTSLMGVGFLPLLCLPSRSLEWLPSLWITLTFWGLKFFCGISYKVEGYLPQKPCLIACNHQSAFETLVFHIILKRPVFIIKKELFSVPLLGWYFLKMGMISVDRSRQLSSLRTLATRVSTKIDQGYSVIIFPEGRRVAFGTREPFKPGIASFYTVLNQSVVPVAINSGRFWGRRSFIKYPGVITIQFIDPIPPGLPSKVFLAQVEETIHAHLSHMTSKEPPYDQN